MNVLLVEDEPRVAAFVSKGLRARGHTVHWASAGRPALLALDGPGWDLVLLDLGLPDIDGLDVLQGIRDRHNTIPVVVVTARDDRESETRAAQLGIRSYLMKPFSFTDLLEIVEEPARPGERADLEPADGQSELDAARP